jgi:hypothetical protein
MRADPILPVRARQLILLFLAALPLARAQAPTPWQDDLVDHLAGSWKLTGTISRQAAHHDVRAAWVLNHQFLRIEERTAADAPADEHRYDAVWFLGFDPVDSTYVLHLMDIFGGRFSETIGRGKRAHDALEFEFAYPDGLFRSTYAWDPQTRAWHWRMEQQDGKGDWSPFADLALVRSGESPHP